MHVSVNVLTWNDLKYLPDLFASLEKQTYQDITIRVLDNASTDGTLEYLKAHHSQFLVARNVRNQGFAGGHNQLMRLALERWAGHDPHDLGILLVNADMILDPHLIERLVARLDSEPKLGAAQPKIYKAYAQVPDELGMENNVLSEVLDTTGLVLNKTWRMEDRGAGEIDKGQYDEALDLIGPAGASALLRGSMLVDVAVDGEFFDSDFFTYREDCDAALRLRRAGWQTQFVPSATAYHYRGMYGAAKRGLWQRLRDRRGQRPFPAAMSTRNQICFLIKNLTGTDVLLYGWRIVPNELLRIVYGLLFEPETRRALLRSAGLWWRMLRKRRQVFAKARESGKVIRMYVGT